jgi:hypothetical protein
MMKSRPALRHDGHGGILDHAHHGPDSALAFTKFLNRHDISPFWVNRFELNPRKLLPRKSILKSP